MRIKLSYKWILTLIVTLVLVGCQDEDGSFDALTQEQKDLIGTAVNFDISIADPFITRSLYNDNGNFCDNDFMRIYRQYANDQGEWESGNESYRGYRFQTDYALGTEILLNQNWKVEKDRLGYNATADALHGQGVFRQLEADSLTWENGQTVRFRAWSRSNYCGSITSQNGKDSYYPDFCIADHVNASGPTNGIPLVLNHMGSRIVFSRKDGANQFQKIEICWEDPDDYRRKDNNTTHTKDDADYEAGKTEEQSIEECLSVRSVYERMCMPAGVDIDGRILEAMPKSLWDNITAKELRYLEEKEDQFVKFEEKTSQEIIDQVQRPVFNHLNGSVYMISIPYDMSNDGSPGEVLTLPACTRFRVYLYDVNNGDQYNTGGYEGSYHLLTLSEIEDEEGNKPFENGMVLLPGYSYRFYVGYRYGELSVTAEDNFSWVRQDLDDENLNNSTVAEPELKAEEFTWWKNAIKQAIPKGAEDFNPVFHISTRKEFLEFIALVNGTATDKTLDDPLTSKITYTTNADKTISKSYQWYKTNEVERGLGGELKYKYYTQQELESEGYVFYEHYHAANADKAAYSETDYLKGNYSFYDDNLRTHFTVLLDADLDLADWELAAIGVTQENSFRGYFDGQGHTISNVFMGSDGYIFGYLDGGSVYNLKVESTHKVSLIREAQNGAYILGISMNADSKTNSIAEKVLGTSFVVGCIHNGDGPYALVGEADNMYMYGCMQTSSSISGGALLNVYSPGATSSFLAPQTGKTISWGRFMCNYYDKTESPSATTISGTADNYHRKEYIRGAKSFVLKAKNDNLIGPTVDWTKLNNVEKEGFYGLAPWKAMNYAIWRYNQTYGKTIHTCTMHYENNTVGYNHQYPVLVPGQCANGTPAAITDYTAINPIEQNN